MNVFDGRALADQVLAEAGEIIGARKLSLGVIVLGEDPVSANFIAQKEKRGAEIGIAVRIYRYPIDTSTRKLREQIADLVKKTKHDGFIVQLPLPEGINTQYALNAVPEDYDVDCLNQKSIGAFVVGRSKNISPAVGALQTPMLYHHIDHRQSNTRHIRIRNNSHRRAYCIRDLRLTQHCNVHKCTEALPQCQDRTSRIVSPREVSHGSLSHLR